MISAAAVNMQSVDNEDNFPDLLASIRARFAQSQGPLFHVNAPDLYDRFLANIPPDLRQHYTCRCCRDFVEHAGLTVTVDEDGKTRSAMWDPSAAPIPFGDAIEVLARTVESLPIDGVFISSDGIWGTPQNRSEKYQRVWTHMAVTPPASMIYRGTPLKNAFQAAAETLQEREMLARGLGEFSLEVVSKAHGFLTSGQLFRSEKHEGVARWLVDLHQKLRDTKNQRARDNLIWLAAATAPAGFCHVRSGMIGTLLEDIVAGYDFSIIKRRFDEKMNPLQYQRPQAPPSEGNIAQANKAIEVLRSAGSFERRFARLDDIKPLWLPKPKAVEPSAGFFSHLTPKEAARSTADMPEVTMTWEKFQRTVLADAEAIEFYVPSGHEAYSALVTATNIDAPPIIQWDLPEARNPVNWYVYHNGSAPSAWNLSAGSYSKVTALTLQPTMWAGNFAHQGESVFFLLQGCRDVRNNGGLALFPEVLKSEYHGIRSTIEAHSRSGKIQGEIEAEACGIRLQKGQRWSARFRVTAKGMRTVYLLDRWD